MNTDPTAAKRNNNIGLIRLVLASLVIIGHAPEQIDGDRHREPLTAIFHTISLGEFSVDGFFILSGYLIAMSWMQSRSLIYFLQRRALRIYPAYIVAFLISTLPVGLLIGANGFAALGDVIRHLVLLQPPPKLPLLDGSAAPLLRGAILPNGMLNGAVLNGSMWTIQVEFRCYLLLAVLGMAGLLNSRRLILSVAAAAVIAAVLAKFEPFNSALASIEGKGWSQALIGYEVRETVRLVAVFLVGAAFYVWRDIWVDRLNGRLAALAGLLLLGCMFVPALAELGLTLLGGYVLFWVSLRADLKGAGAINRSWDISYGTYLYGWPIAIVVLHCYPSISPWLLGPVALTLSLLAGAVSWFAVEKWTKDLFRRRAAPRVAL